MSAPGQILVAGIGNIFFGDDAFGSEVAAQLRYLNWPAHVHVEDFGIRGEAFRTDREDRESLLCCSSRFRSK